MTPPSWRPDLTDPADLAEEVIRLEGYENIPVRMPRALAGRGLTPRQRLRRSVGRTLAESGFVEILSSPFGSRSDADLLGLPPEDLRRPAVVVANPLSEDEPLLRTTLLPGLFRVLVRNIGRGFADTALFEIGLVFRPRPGAADSAPILAIDRGPTVAELASLDAALPDQPLRVGAVLTGERELAGWWGQGRAASWADAIEAARAIGRICRVRLEVRADKHAPWHPGRCAALYVQVADSDGPREWLAGHAGELHPRVIEAYGLPPRTCALELDLSVVFTAAEAAGPVQAPQLSAYPLATQDVALVVDAAVPAAEVEAALVAGAPEGTARGRAAVRRVHRRPGRRGPQVAGLHAQVPRPGPDAHRRRGHGGPRRGRGRGRPPGRRRPAQLAARRLDRLASAPTGADRRARICACGPVRFDSPRVAAEPA